MTDTFSAKERSTIMSRIRSRNTAPEKSVKRALRNIGKHFRANVRKLPGCPDIAVESKKTAIFVHGCFWHQHSGCRRSTIPKTNHKYWALKLARNKTRDRRCARLIRSRGWTAATIWECQTKNPTRLTARLNTILKIAGQVRG